MSQKAALSGAVPPEASPRPHALPDGTPFRESPADARSGHTPFRDPPGAPSADGEASPAGGEDTLLAPPATPGQTPIRFAMGAFLSIAAIPLSSPGVAPFLAGAVVPADIIPWLALCPGLALMLLDRIDLRGCISVRDRIVRQAVARRHGDRDLAQIVSQLPLGVALFRESGLLAHANTRYDLLLGHGISARTGTHCCRLLADAGRDGETAPPVTIGRNGFQAWEQSIISAQGRPVLFRNRSRGWVRMWNTRLADGSVLSTLADASGEMESLENVRQDASMLERLVEGIPDGLAIIDRLGRILVCNTRLLDIMDIPAGQPDRMERGERELAARMAQARWYRVAHEGDGRREVSITGSGNHVPLRIARLPLADGGTVLHVAPVRLRDTGSPLTRVAGGKLDQILGRSPSAAGVFNPARECIYLNASGERLFGRSAGDDGVHRLEDFFGDPGQADLLLSRLRQEDDPPGEQRARMRTAAGEVFAAEISAHMTEYGGNPAIVLTAVPVRAGEGGSQGLPRPRR